MNVRSVRRQDRDTPTAAVALRDSESRTVRRPTDSSDRATWRASVDPVPIAPVAADQHQTRTVEGRRLRGGWVVVTIGGLLVCAREVVAIVMPTEPLLAAMVQNGIDETVARDLIDRGLYSLDTMIGAWFILAGGILTVAGSVLAIRDRRFRRCELCRAVVRVDSYREHLIAEHPTGLETP